MIATPLRLAELMTAVSLATDIGVGAPMELVLATCLVSMRIGEALGLTEQELHQVYYLALLRHTGCTAEASQSSELMGDELQVTQAWFRARPTHPLQMLHVMWREVVDQRPALFERAGLFARLMIELPSIVTAHCEVAQQFAARCGFDEQVQMGLRQFGERWDGNGIPNKRKGEAIALPVRIAQVARDAVAIQHFFSTDQAIAALRERAGHTLDPGIVTTVCARASTMLALPTSLRDEVLACEPGVHRLLDETQFEAACRALADFADLQTSFSVGHSPAVAALAERAGQVWRLPEAELRQLRWAGYLHDIGRVGISASLWNKAGPLSEREWERVRLHPYYTLRILAFPSSLTEIGAISGAHHERLDGTGYPRSLPAPMLTPAMRLLAVAETYQALCEPRPYRPAHGRDAAAAVLKRDVREAKLDSEAVNAVLAAMGHTVPQVRRQRVADLTDREIDVIRLLARGYSNAAIATALTISPKTVSRHLESIYSKLDVTTRAAATYYAMQHNLL